MLKDFVAAIERNILELEPFEFSVILGVMAVICLFTLYRMTRVLHQARLIENTPTAKIRSAVQGYVELNGQTLLMNGPVIVSPLSGKTCVWYRYKIEEKIEDIEDRR